jgi:hypothetical protein
MIDTIARGYNIYVATAHLYMQDHSRVVVVCGTLDVILCGTFDGVTQEEFGEAIIAPLASFNARFVTVRATRRWDGVDWDVANISNTVSTRVDGLFRLTNPSGGIAASDRIFNGALSPRGIPSYSIRMQLNGRPWSSSLMHAHISSQGIDNTYMFTVVY